MVKYFSATNRASIASFLLCRPAHCLGVWADPVVQPVVFYSDRLNDGPADGSAALTRRLARHLLVRPTRSMYAWSLDKKTFGRAAPDVCVTFFYVDVWATPMISHKAPRSLRPRAQFLSPDQSGDYGFETTPLDTYGQPEITVWPPNRKWLYLMNCDRQHRNFNGKMLCCGPLQWVWRARRQCLHEIATATNTGNGNMAANCCQVQLNFGSHYRIMNAERQC